MIEKSVNKNIDSIYALKAICSFLVVLIHTNFFFKCYLSPIYRLAVPIFFIIAGYFLSTETEIKIEKIQKAIKKIFIINIYASLVYILYRAFVIVVICKSSINIKQILFFSDLKQFLLSNPYCHVLWYLVAYIETLIIIYLFAKCKKEKFLLKAVGVFYLMGLICGTYNFNYFDISLEEKRNVFTMGLPFVLTGIYLRIHKSYFSNTKNIIIIGYSLLFLVLNYIELYTLRNNNFDNGEYYLFTIPLSISIFIFFINNPSIITSKYLIRIGKNHSLFIFLYHWLVIIIINKLNDKHTLFPNHIEFIIIVIITLTLSYIRLKAITIIAKFSFLNRKHNY